MSLSQVRHFDGMIPCYLKRVREISDDVSENFHTNKKIACNYTLIDLSSIHCVVFCHIIWTDWYQL